MSPLLWLALGLAAIYFNRYHAPDNVRTTGAVTLHANVLYRFELFWPKGSESATADITLPTAQAAVLTELVARGMLNPEMQQTPTGMLIRYQATPTVPTSIVIGSVIFGPAVLRSVTRMDGKAWNTV